MNRSRTEKYLDKYLLKNYTVETNVKTIKYAVVVPAIAEYDNIRIFLNSFQQQDRTYFKDTLLLFVINNSALSEISVKINNKETLQYIRSVQNISDINIGLIDASSEGNELPVKDAGVGLARKTGMDAVLPLFENEDKGLLICTDADCTFADNYLTEIVNYFKNTSFQAAYVNFLHSINDDITADAVICYEIFLRYYVLGLVYSESPFAFHTIGSSMVTTSKAYMDIEGMNKKKAAEDFYFLEKIAKKYKIGRINTTTVYPSSRSSWRVPFGTGQRVNRFLSKKHIEYVLYHPDCFRVLRKWHKLFFNNSILTSKEYLVQAEEINTSLFLFLKEQGFEKDWENISANIKKTSSVMNQKIRWFDGFRTLKLVHYLRDTEFGVVSMFDAADELFLMINSGVKINRNSLIPDRITQIEYLNKFREIDIK
jgi:hypothetical protein